jgi:hypothetical protein
MSCSPVGLLVVMLRLETYLLDVSIDNNSIDMATVVLLVEC